MVLSQPTNVYIVHFCIRICSTLPLSSKTCLFDCCVFVLERPGERIRVSMVTLGGAEFIGHQAHAIVMFDCCVFVVATLKLRLMITTTAISMDCSDHGINYACSFVVETELPNATLRFACSLCRLFVCPSVGGGQRIIYGQYLRN
jgi:hypothetical protein